MIISENYFISVYTKDLINIIISRIHEDAYQSCVLCLDVLRIKSMVYQTRVDGREIFIFVVCHYCSNPDSSFPILDIPHKSVDEIIEESIILRVVNELQDS
jgi:hypothetical protein